MEKVTVSLKLRIIGAMIGIGALGAIMVGAASYFAAADIVMRQTEARMDREIAGKIESFQRLEATVTSDLKLRTGALFGVEAARSFANSFEDAGAIQRAYIQNNPHSTGEKHHVDAA